MSAIPSNYIQFKGQWWHPTEFKRVFGAVLNPEYDKLEKQGKPPVSFMTADGTFTHRPRKTLLNKTEQRWKGVLLGRGVVGIMDQAIKLRLDPPYKTYTADLAYLGKSGLTLVEVKGPHRFRRAGIAKAALAAKTYPQFRFELADWTGKEWKESVLSP